MTPEEQKSLEYYSREIAKILYKNSESEMVETLEGIEKTVRAQVLEHISPQIGVFLSKLAQEQPEVVSED